MSTDDTKQKIINATGELAAERGIDNVSTRAIAERSGENIGSIHYHFGGKDGLLTAMVHEATACCASDKLYDTVNALTESSSPEDFSNAIRVITASEIKNLFQSGLPEWYSQVIYQLLQRDDSLYEIVQRELLDPSMNAFARLFSLIDPTIDSDTVFIYSTLLRMPIFAHANYMKAMHKRLNVTRYSDEYFNKLEDLLVRQTLLNIGLPNTKTL